MHTFIIFPAVCVNNMKQILCSDWLPEFILPAQDYPL